MGRTVVVVIHDHCVWTSERSDNAVRLRQTDFGAHHFAPAISTGDYEVCPRSHLTVRHSSSSRARLTLTSGPSSFHDFKMGSGTRRKLRRSLVNTQRPTNLSIRETYSSTGGSLVVKELRGSVEVVSPL